jgi:hypothetical protein
VPRRIPPPHPVLSSAALPPAAARGAALICAGLRCAAFVCAGLVCAALACAAVPRRARAQDAALDVAQLRLEAVALAGDAGADTRAAPLAAAEGPLAAGQPRGVLAVVPGGRCVLASARAAPGLGGLGLEVSRGRTVVARAEAPAGARALTLHHCGGARDERVQVRLRAAEGAGAFAVVVLPLPPGTTAADVEARAAAAREEGLLARLSAVVARLAAGATPVTAPARESLSAGQRVERVVPLAAGRCYRVLTAAEPGVVDVDLALVPPPPPPPPPPQLQRAVGAPAPPAPTAGPAGPVRRGPEAPLATDGTRAADPTLGVGTPLCATRNGDHRLQLTMVEGAGALAWQVVTSASAAPDAAGASGSPAAPASAAPGAEVPRFAVGGAANDYVASRIRLRYGAAGEGRAPVTDLVSGTLRTSEEHTTELRVEGGRCYVVLGAGAPSVAELDLRVVDALGAELAADAERDALPRARFCTLAPTRVRITARMFRGYGPFGFQVFGGPR